MAVVGVLVIIAGVVGGILLAQTSSASDRLVDRITPALGDAYRLQAALVDQETGLRGYALTADPQFLEPYDNGLADERAAGDELARVARGEPRLAGDLTQVLAAARAWQSRYADPMIARVRVHGPGAVPKPIIDQSKTAFDQMRAQWSAQITHLEQARASGHRHLQHVTAFRDAVFAALMLIILCTGILLAILLHYAIGRPLRALEAATGAVAQGDFKKTIAVRGPADLERVAAGVEAMRRRILQDLSLATEREELLERRTADLDAQAVELRRSNAELEQFAYVASHDLQEPLRKVVSFCQLLEKRYGDQLDERAGTYIAFAVDGAKRMQVLIDDLLTFSRVGRVSESEQTVALGESLDRAIQNLEGAIQETGARVYHPEELPSVIGVATQLTMLWQNLIGNAIKFHAPDRGPVVRIYCEPHEDGHLFTVTDNGIGIPPEFADKIFIIFQRLHNREAYAGTGIGLALCKKIVEQHGGRIWVDTGFTGGTRIRFTLRTITPEEPAAEPQDEGEDGEIDETGETGKAHEAGEVSEASETSGEKGEG
jgi:signal transduction histidine kinase